MEEFKLKLESGLESAKKIVFMGIGEEKLSDDGVGPYIISELLNYSNSYVKFINAHIDPMNRIDDIIEFHPTHLVLIDTCTLNKEPGTVAILNRSSMQAYLPISTHTIPIHIVVDLIIEKLPDLKSFMIGIVPESLDGFKTLKLYKEKEYSLTERSENEDLPFFDFNLTETIMYAADRLIELIKEIAKRFS